MSTRSLSLLVIKPRLTDVVVAAVEDGLVAAADLADVRERLDDPQPELLPLLLLVDRDVLDVPHAPEPAQELALEEHAARADDAVRGRVNDDDGEVRLWRGLHRAELLAPGGGADVGRGGQDA